MPFMYDASGRKKFVSSSARRRPTRPTLPSALPATASTLNDDGGALTLDGTREPRDPQAFAAWQARRADGR